MRFGVYREIEVEVCRGQAHGGVGRAMGAGVSWVMYIDISRVKEVGACLGWGSEPCLEIDVVVHVPMWGLSRSLAQNLLVRMGDEAAVQFGGGMEAGMGQQRLQLVVDKIFHLVSRVPPHNDRYGHGFSGQGHGRFLSHSSLHRHDHQNH